MRPMTAAQRCALIAADGGLTRYQVGRWYPTGMGPPVGRAYGSGTVLALVRRGFRTTTLREHPARGHE